MLDLVIEYCWMTKIMAVHFSAFVPEVLFITFSQVFFEVFKKYKLWTKPTSYEVNHKLIFEYSNKKSIWKEKTTTITWRIVNWICVSIEAVVYGKPNGSEFAWFSPPCDY